MSLNGIRFFNEHPSFKISEVTKFKKWIINVIQGENFDLNSLNIILIDKTALLKLNKEFLERDHDTDVITFDQSEQKGVVEGEIYVSVDVVKENAKHFKVKQMEELRRVVIHGVLHLLGFDDNSDKSKKLIRDKENQYLDIF